MTSYFSLSFLLLLFPFSIAAYGLVPRRFRWAVLLAVSYVFIWFLSDWLIVFILASTASVYLCGRWLGALVAKRDAELGSVGMDGEPGGKHGKATDKADKADRLGKSDSVADKTEKKRIREEKKRIKATFKRRMGWVLAGGVVLNLGILVVLKYLGFLFSIGSSLLSVIGLDMTLTAPSIGAPIGISFYTLMAVSYLTDVYHESVAPETHIGKLALFLSFFPQIMEGPICRYGQTADALFAGEPIGRENASTGLLRILIGVAKKLLVADRLNIFVKTAFDGHDSYDGGIVALAAVLYTVQLYFDFSGTMDVAIGMGRVFGVTLPENFRQPFFSKTASEFWTRWHITLGEWFKSYVYYPVSLSRLGKRISRAARKRLGMRYGPLLSGAIALFCVWLGNGLWHGAGSQYIFFGMYYFVIILAGGLIEPVAADLSAKVGLDRSSRPYRVFQGVRTIAVVFVGEMFFRAASMEDGMRMFHTLVTNFTLDSVAGGKVLSMGLDVCDIAIVAIACAVMWGVGLAKERGYEIVPQFPSAVVPVRVGVYVGLMTLVLVFGAYGTEYLPVVPMYAQF